MNDWYRKKDVLREKYATDDALCWAKEVLQKEDQTEEAFLGAQGVLLLHGLI